MTTPVDSSLMALRLAKPTLQIQVVSRKVGGIAASEQPRPETCHQLGKMLTHRILVVSKSVAQSIELRLTFVATSRLRVQSLADATYLARMGSYFLEDLLCQGTPSINASG
jgi:hypothetical protein